MFDAVHIVGTGRAGGAIRARLAERGLRVTDGRDPDPTAELVLLCVPDHVIGEVAQAHPARSMGGTRQRSDPAWRPRPARAAVQRSSAPDADAGTRCRSSSTGHGAPSARRPTTALARARWLAETLGLRPFEVADADRALYHAAAVIGGNYLVTLHEVAGRLLDQVGAPPEAIVPLMARTIENGFDLTGPIARGDWSTVEAHVAVLEERAPELVPLYRALAEATPR